MSFSIKHYERKVLIQINVLIIKENVSAHDPEVKILFSCPTQQNTKFPLPHSIILKCQQVLAF